MRFQTEAQKDRELARLMRAAEAYTDPRRLGRADDAVMAACECSRSTAFRLIRKAREHGLL